MTVLTDGLPTGLGDGVRRRADLRRWAWVLLPPFLTAVALFFVTELPYAFGRSSDLPGHRFDGLIAYTKDIHAYFSFARQSAEGRWLFENRFAPESHAAIFFNLEWLAVGKAMPWLGDPGVFVAWRAAGILSLVSGFWALASQFGNRAGRLLALTVFAFGGGFGWLLQTAQALGAIEVVRRGAFAEWVASDQSWGVQPFVQMLQNPHFSVAHGLVLFALAFLVRAERTSRASSYAAAGLFALIACLCRPYEGIAFLAVVLLLHAVSGVAADFRSGSRRALTLVLLAPAAIPLAPLWLSPSFQPWASQAVMPVIPLYAYAILLGIPAVLLSVRLLTERGLRFGDPGERVLWLWGGAVLFLSQANRFTSLLPYSPQLLITCLGPIVLLGVPRILEARRPGGSARNRAWVVASVLALALPSSAIVVSQRCREASRLPSLFASDGERAAWDWLAERVEAHDVVLATVRSSNRLPRHAPVHVVAGHWPLSPEYYRRAEEIRAFFEGKMAPDDAADYLRRFGIDWIWLGPAERTMGGWSRDDFAPGCELCYERLGVRLYRCGE
jgi:hypothetical protein